MSDNKNDQVKPFSKTQSEVFAKMTPATQKIAQMCEQRSDKAAKGQVLTYWAIGRDVSDALDADKQAMYGADAAKQLASYIPLIEGDTTLLYNLKNFALTYTKEYIEERTGRLLNRGGYMQLAHWLALTRIESEKDRENMLNQIIRKSLSAAEVTRQIRAGEVGKKNTRTGGRTPAVPTSPMSGLQRLSQTGLAFSNMANAYDKSVFGVIAKLPDEQITEALLTKLDEVIEVVTKDETTAKATKDRMVDLREHVSTRLEEISAAAAQAAEDAAAAEANAAEVADDAEEKPKAKKKPVAKKPAGGKRPVAATT